MLYKNITITALGLITGITLYILTSMPYYYVLVPFIVALPLALYILHKESKWREIPILFSLLSFFIVGMCAGYVRMHIGMLPVESSETLSKITSTSNQIEFEGRVISLPTLRSSVETELILSITKTFNTTTNTWTNVTPHKVIVTVEKSETQKSVLFETVSDNEIYGRILVIRGIVKKPSPPLNPGEFDYISYMQRNNVQALIVCPSSDISLLENRSIFSFKKASRFLKEKFIQTYRRTIPSPQSRVISSLILGSRRALDGIVYNDRNLTDILTQSGLYYFITNSGLHVTIIALILYALFIAIGFTPRYFAPGIIVLLLVFIFCTGARPEALRAVIVNIFAILVFSYLRYNIRKSAIIGLAATALITLIHDPFTLFSFSFILSFGVIFILITCTPPIMRWLNMMRGFTLGFFVLFYFFLIFLAHLDVHYFIQIESIILLCTTAWIFTRVGRLLNNRFPFMWNLSFLALPSPFRALVAFLIALQLGVVIPISAWEFGQYPVNTLLTYFVTIPFLGLSLLLGVLSGIVGLIPSIGVWLAMPLSATTSLCTDIILQISNIGSNFFSSQALPKPQFVWLCIYFLIMMALLYSHLLLPHIRSIVYKLEKHLSTTLIRTVPIVIGVLLIIIPLFFIFVQTERSVKLIVFHTKKYPITSIVLNNGIAGLIVPSTESLEVKNITNGIRSQQGTSLAAIISNIHNPQILSDISQLNRQGFATPLLLLPQSKKKQDLANKTVIKRGYVNFYNLSPNARISFAPDIDEKLYTQITMFGKNLIIINSFQEYRSQALAAISNISVLIIPDIESEEEKNIAHEIISETGATTVIITNGKSDYAFAIANELGIKSKIKRTIFRTAVSGTLFMEISKSGSIIDSLADKRRRQQVIIRAFLQ